MTHRVVSTALLVIGAVLVAQVGLAETLSPEGAKARANAQVGEGSALAALDDSPGAVDAFTAGLARAKSTGDSIARRGLRHAKVPAPRGDKAPGDAGASGGGLAGKALGGVMKALRRVEGAVRRLAGDSSELRDIKPLLDRVSALEPRMRALTDERLKGLTAEFKARLEAGETMDAILPEAFAALREAARRTVGMRPYDVQILGAIALHQGKVIEMGTGEGKTLVATLPVYLNALTGKGVHVVTVNETLAQRDAEWMGRVYQFMGLSVGVVTEDMTHAQKRAGYQADVTYLTNVSLGFDYLRDNMANSPAERVAREPNFALVDEVDEILIDEARTPLIISQSNRSSTRDYAAFDRVVSLLQPEEDFEVDLKDRRAWLTEPGLAKVERMLGVDNLHDEENLDKLRYLGAALNARTLFHKDKDYVVDDRGAHIVDEFVGRIMDGRRYTDGIHQALEAKEGVPIQPESRTLASITYPNLFRRYPKLAGMSGTAKTEAREFHSLYGLPVVVIPPNKPSQRKDEPDLVFGTAQEKFDAIVAYVERAYQEGRPVLIGTRNIIANEHLHQLLAARGVPHQLLNAKSVKDNTEAENAIVAQAGRSGMVTLATNMAGRGVDIKPDYVNFKRLAAESLSHLEAGRRVLVTMPKAEDVGALRTWLEASGVAVAQAAPALSEALGARPASLFASAGPGAPRPRVQIVVDDRPPAEQAAPPSISVNGIAVLQGSAEKFATGGLHVVGTERHDARRIDNQLKGRAGRQGKPGTTQFFISLEDELMSIFGGARLKSVFERFGIQNGQAAQNFLLDRAIASAQEKVESMHFDMRKNTTEYDHVLNMQRELMYRDRNALLDGHDLSDTAMEWASLGIDRAFTAEGLDGRKASLARAEAGWDRIAEEFGLPRSPRPASLIGKKVDVDRLYAEIEERVLGRLEFQSRAGGSQAWQEFLRDLSLDALDETWFGHLEDMQHLREGVGLVVVGEQDPQIVYVRRAYELWEEARVRFESRVVQEALGAAFVAAGEVAPAASALAAPEPPSELAAAPVRVPAAQAAPAARAVSN